MEQHIIQVPTILHITQLHPSNTSDPIGSIKYCHTLNLNHKGVQMTMLCHMISPFKNLNGKKSGNMISSCIDASLKTFMRNRIGKIHKA
jgi:hypothetical protein